jgi:hypothetical protein
MTEFNKEPKQEPELSIYDPDCAIYSPHIIEEWKRTIETTPDSNDQYISALITLVQYCHEKNKKYPDAKEYWIRNIISYSFFFGLGITIFEKKFAQQIISGLSEGWSRRILFWINQIKLSKQEDNSQLWNHTINVITESAGSAWPAMVGPDADGELIKQSAPIAGFAPAIRLGLNDPSFASKLFEGALDERKKCNDENIVKRLNWMKAFILTSKSQEETSKYN